MFSPKARNSHNKKRKYCPIFHVCGLFKKTFRILLFSKTLPVDACNRDCIITLTSQDCSAECRQVQVTSEIHLSSILGYVRSPFFGLWVRQGQANEKEARTNPVAEIRLTGCELKLQGGSRAGQVSVHEEKNMLNCTAMHAKLTTV